MTLPEQFFRTAQRFGDRTALKHKPGKEYVYISFNQVAEEIRTVAAALMALGFKPGDRAALLMENRPEWIICDLGILLAGGVSVPIHTAFSPRLIAGVLKDSGCRILLVSSQESLDKVIPHLADLPDLRQVICLGAKPSCKSPGDRFLSWEEFKKLGTPETDFPLRSPDDLASLVYTSGTTGTPKGVMLTHRNLLSNALAALQAIPFNDQDTLLSFLPLSHSLPRLGDYYAAFVCAGATIAFAKSLKELGKNIAEVRPTCLIVVPRIFEGLHDGIRQKIRQKGKAAEWLFFGALKAEPGSLPHRLADRLLLHKIRQGLGGRLRFVVSGGAALNPELIRFFRQVGITVLEGYGLTEASPVVSANRLDRAKIGSVGLPLEGVEVRIAADRELLVRGPNVTQGYWNNPTATAEILDADGWLHTGDLASLDEDGFLSIVGRKKEMIVSAAGKNVWPDPIEMRLKGSRYIFQAMVVGEGQTQMAALIVPDWAALKEFAREKGIAGSRPEILKHPHVLLLYRQEVEHANTDLADYERIARFNLVEHEFTADREEMTPTLKLVRSVIAAHYAGEIREMGRGKIR